jgi:mannose-6-phosphate isomerase-like protein (cupin superfamily)
MQIAGRRDDVVLLLTRSGTEELTAERVPMMNFSIAEAVGRLMSDNTDYARLFERDSFDIGMYRPVKVDQQTPHSRDEVYIIAAGSGEFVCGDENRTFSTGDVFFVPAGVEHRFTKFSYDFATWVIFFGKIGE